MGSISKNVIVLGGLALIAAGGYYLMVIKRDATISGNNSIVVGQTEQETQEFLAQLDDLQAIELSSAIFADPRFTTLEDYTEPVSPVPFGRDNPFGAQ